MSTKDSPNLGFVYSNSAYLVSLQGLSQINKVAKPKWQNPWSEFVGNHAMEVEVGYLDDSSAVEHFGKGPLRLRHTN